MRSFLFHRLLWRPAQTANVTNERIAGFGPSWPNPAVVSRVITHALFFLEVQTQTAIQLTRVAIYGAEWTDDGSPATALQFPAPGAGAEALAEWTGAPILAVGQGSMRAPSQLSQAGQRFHVTALPRYLLCEYSTAGAGGGANLLFKVALLGAGSVEDVQVIGR